MPSLLQKTSLCRAAFTLFLFTFFLVGSAVAAPATYRLSVAATGGSPDSASLYSAVSENGRYVAFQSSAANIVPGDTNAADDIFLRDRVTGATERVSVANDEAQAAGSSSSPAISANGRYVAFQSTAENLVPGYNNGFGDIFVRDRVTGTTEIVSVDGIGGESEGPSSAPAISADGRYVAFQSIASNLDIADSNGADDIFVHDRVTGSTKQVSVDTNGNDTNGESAAPAISADGRYITFQSFASDLVSGDTNTAFDIFAYDRVTASTERISVDDGGNEVNGISIYPSISADGRYVAFGSTAGDVVPNDLNNAMDLFLHDRQAGTVERVTVSSLGTGANLSSSHPSISADGRYVAFSSTASNLVASDQNGGPDVFVRDRQLGTTERVSVKTDGSEPNGWSGMPSISADGRYVVFQSYADDLAPGDTNTASDIFVRRLGDGLGPSASFSPSVSDATVYFDGSGSSSPDGLALTYGWDFGDGSDGQGKQAKHVYAKSGTYQVKLTVTDSEGLVAVKVASVSVTVPVPASGSPSSGGTTAGTGTTAVVKLGRLAVVGRSARVTSAGRGALKVSCPSTAKGRCAGTLKLVAKLGKKTATVATKRFSVGAGKQTGVSFKLSKKALKALKKGKKLKVTVTAVSADQAVAATSAKVAVTLRLAKR